MCLADVELLDWPMEECFLRLEGIEQQSDGGCRCTAVAVCDDTGKAARWFHQGQWAHFYYEFVAGPGMEEETPSGGLLFGDASGRPVFGKNSFQVDEGLAGGVRAGTRLRFHQSVKLDLAYGRYSVQVGLASAADALCREYREGSLSHHEFQQATRVRCALPEAVVLDVGFMPGGKLLHHGMANLPGEFRAAVIEAGEAPVDSVDSGGVWQGLGETAKKPTIFHITHWKAGSQWLYRILEAAAGKERLVRPELGEAQFVNWPVREGRVYPTLYVTHEQFQAAWVPPGSARFVVIRDLRDTLVSAYFSLKVSHGTSGDPQMEQWRSNLQAMDVEDGLLCVMDGWVAMCAKIQLSWIEAGDRLIRYEDLLERDVEILEPLLLDHCQLDIGRDRLREIIVTNRFRAVTGGRARGEENVQAHERKGVAGDWRNYFTPRVKAGFKLRYGGLLVASGYEQGLDW